MKRFEIGDKVIALTNPPNRFHQFRVKGNIYTVTALLYCPITGEQSVNINDTLGATGSRQLNCGYCKKVHQLETKLAYTRVVHFAKVEDLQQEIEEAVEKEDYETAALLRDLTK